MPKKYKSMASLFNINPRFLRSVHLEQDFDTPESCEGYILTEHTKSCLERLAEGLMPGSTRRAWRLTGDYGAGKSSFALILAYLFSGRRNKLPKQLQMAIRFNWSISRASHLVPVLITGSREPLGVAVLSALNRTITKIYTNGSNAKLTRRIAHLVKRGKQPSDTEVVDILCQFSKKIRSDSKGNGIILILDELGKFLEYAAMHPEKQDVFLLQRLAESAARSDDSPIFVLGLLHQGFNAYSDFLDQASKREWEKIAGRFEEILFNHPLGQIVVFLTSALGVNTKTLFDKHRKEASTQMQFAIKKGWFGPVSARKRLIARASGLFPLDPLLLPIMTRVFRRFGQNERSLFSFIQSSEPFGLQAYSMRLLSNPKLYRIHDFYDYARANLSHQLGLQSTQTHWNAIDSIIQSHSCNDEIEIDVLKTVGIFNLLNSNDLVPTEDVVVQAVAGTQSSLRKMAKQIIRALKQKEGLLYDRGTSGGLCLWPHTSVDLNGAYNEALRQIGTIHKVSDRITGNLDQKPIVVRRHYIQTGNLRYFEIRYLSAHDFLELSPGPAKEADGTIIVVLSDTQQERRKVLIAAKSAAYTDHSDIIIACPSPLNNVAKYLHEYLCWDWVSKNTLSLNSDPFAREEVSRQVRAAHENLMKRIYGLVDLRRYTRQLTINWFSQGKSLSISTGKQLLSYLSDVCDELYTEAPIVRNELINRRRLSSAAAAARMRLIGRILKMEAEPNLGMPEDKRPPEMSIYLSILHKGNVHIERKQKWQIQEPPPSSDHCRLSPALKYINRILKTEVDKKVAVSDIFEELHKPPYGIHDGLLPVLLAIYVVTHRQDIALFEDGTFLRGIEEEEFLRLTKEPEHFEIQYCKIQGVRAEVFDRLIKVLKLKKVPGRNSELLDVVQPLCVFAAQLPEFVHKTKGLTQESIAVRDSVLTAHEPAPLLFSELPTACGLGVFDLTGRIKDDRVEVFANKLKLCLQELKNSYAELLSRLESALREVFSISSDPTRLRELLAARSSAMIVSITEPKLKAFCLRLVDENLSDTKWIESIASFVASKPPTRWNDQDEFVFQQELQTLAYRFKHVESIHFNQSDAIKGHKGIRLSITQSDGTEREEVLFRNPEVKRALTQIQDHIQAILSKHGRIGLTALSLAAWNELSKNPEESDQYEQNYPSYS